MNKTIPINPKFKFCFVEDKEMLGEHPVSDYYFKINDLSINTSISFKWIFWGFYFFKSISSEINDPEFDIRDALDDRVLKQWNFPEKSEHQLFFNDMPINSEKELRAMIETDYDLPIFDENTKVHVKLKLNLDEYLIITNAYFPTLLYFTEEIICK